MMAPEVNYPKDAKPEDCQRIVRMMWKKEFTGDRLKDYLNAVNTNEPTLACPMTGKERLTWQNGWIINPAGAKELLKTFHKDENRYYYECMIDLLNKYPDRYILGINPGYRFVDTINSPRYACACYRPDSLYPNYDELWGRKYFKDHDDEFYKLLAVLNESHYVPINISNYIDVDMFNQDVKLSTLGNTQYNNLGAMWVHCFNENPEIGKLFLKNKNIKN